MARLLSAIAISLVVAPAHAAEPAATNRDRAEGIALAAELTALQPTSSATNAAVLEIRDAQGSRTRVPLTIMTLVGAGQAPGWTTSYITRPDNAGPGESLTILQAPNQPPSYLRGTSAPGQPDVIPAGRAFVPFANSDFWLSDLGLEFLHWTDQRILPGPRGNPPMVKGRSCKVLESRGPAGSPYSKVVSWIDNEFKSIIQADAYDPNGKLLKRFSVGSFKKVDGVWQLKDMEMIDERRDTKTKLEFDLKVREQ